MDDPTLFISILVLHAVLLLLALLTLCARRQWERRCHLGWMACIPLFGPLIGLLMLRPDFGNAARLRIQLEELHQNEENHRRIVHSTQDAEEAVPLEEALLINEPRKRRKLMMQILRQDPLRYLDLLLLARFNEDTETAHYATATIMELQRDLVLEIQRMQTTVAKQPNDFDGWKTYATLLSRYVQSGLLEGQLLARQRTTLAQALDQALALQADITLLCDKVENCIQLQDGATARVAAEQCITLYPTDERAWLSLLRVDVETRDRQGLAALLERMEGEAIDWTLEGREKIRFYAEGFK